MRLAWVVVLGGCIEGIGPTIAIGPQGTGRSAPEVGVQLGVEATAGLPVLAGTAGVYWFQSHGLAWSAHGDIGWDAAYHVGDGGGLGGGFELGLLKLSDDTMAREYLGMRANGALRLVDAKCPNGIVPDDPRAVSRSQYGWSASLTISLRWNPNGWAVVLAPRAIYVQLFCFDG